MRGLERAKAFIRAHQGAHDGRIRGMLYPLQVDTCSPELFRATRKAADELGVGISTHVGQNLVEFHEMLRRHGKTPVELLDDAGLLGPGTILGHCLLTTRTASPRCPPAATSRSSRGAASPSPTALSCSRAGATRSSPSTATARPA